MGIAQEVGSKTGSKPCKQQNYFCWADGNVEKDKLLLVTSRGSWILLQSLGNLGTSLNLFSPCDNVSPSYSKIASNLVRKHLAQ